MNRLPLRWGLPSRISAFPNPTPALRTSIHPRYYSNPPTSDPTTSPRLAKPTRYNPPSHPSRSEFTRTRAIPQFPLQPPGSSSSNTRNPAHYPTTLPPPGTFTYWFLTSRRLHFYLSLGILTTLAAIVSVTNFLRTSPYAQLVPEWSWSSPRECVGGFVDAVKMHWENESRVAEERRRERGREVERRGEYRKRHGLEQVGGEGGLGGWGLRRGEEEGKGREKSVLGEGEEER